MTARIKQTFNPKIYIAADFPFLETQILNHAIHSDAFWNKTISVF